MFVKIYISKQQTFRGIHPYIQQKILRNFLSDCSPAPCFCTEPCGSPGLSRLLPEDLRLNLHLYNHHFDVETTARLQGAWKCQETVLDDVYIPLESRQRYEAAHVANNLLFGLSEAVYSLNDSGVSPAVSLCDHILMLF